MGFLLFSLFFFSFLSVTSFIAASIEFSTVKQCSYPIRKCLVAQNSHTTIVPVDTLPTKSAALEDAESSAGSQLVKHPALHTQDCGN